jgi:hypothetical protein
MELVPLEFYLYRSSKTVGLLAPALTSLFPTRLTVFPSVPAPIPLLVWVHPLMRFTSPTERFSIVTRPSPPTEIDTLEHLPWGSAPLRDINGWSPLTVSFPRLT